ncbi:MAG: glycosyltransferase [Oscillospiraceae bacterium]|nr:glycosyltransferase [Oscillospiraceae bacterium]
MSKIIIERESPGKLEFKELPSQCALGGYFWRAAKSKGSPKLSVAVMSHRNLESLKACVGCLLDFAPAGLDYELVLMDNASEDGGETLAFMESVFHPRKKIIAMKDNMGPYFNAARGWSVLWSHCEGDYILHLNDDHFVTENAIFNMIRALDSDDSIGMVNPVSSNAWMGQNPGLSFGSSEEMQAAAKAFNAYDPKKWEERIYVAAVAWMFRRELLGCLTPANPFGPELCYDIAIRLAGYRVMLLGDSWVHHNHDYSQKESYGFAGDSPAKIRQREYISRSTAHLSFGLSFFGDICAFEKPLASIMSPPIKETPALLSVDVKAGQGLLDLKNALRARGIFNATSAAFSSEAKYYPILYTVADEVILDRVSHIREALSARKFDLIIAGVPVNLYLDPMGLLEALLEALNPGGQLLFKLRNTSSAAYAQKMLGIADAAPDMPTVISETTLAQRLAAMGCPGALILPGEFLGSHNEIEAANLISASCPEEKREELRARMLIRDFHVRATRPV